MDCKKVLTVSFCTNNEGLAGKILVGYEEAQISAIERSLGTNLRFILARRLKWTQKETSIEDRCCICLEESNMVRPLGHPSCSPLHFLHKNCLGEYAQHCQLFSNITRCPAGCSEFLT